MKTGSETKQMIDIWDSHFHVWDISENTNSGHDDADNSGIIIGQDDSEQAQFMNQEDADMFFGVNKIERYFLSDSSYIFHYWCLI